MFLPFLLSFSLWFTPPPPPRFICGAATPTSTPGIYSWRSCPDRPVRRGR